MKDLKVLWEDGEHWLCRGLRGDDAGDSVLVVIPHGQGSANARLHEYNLRDDLDCAWAARPLELRRDGERTLLLIKDPGGEPLGRHIGEPMDVGGFLRLSIGVAATLSRAHRSGLVHRDVKPGNILINCADGGVRLTGFGIASRLPAQRQAPDPPEVIAGTLAYMAPEQTGRMNRSIDFRSDLYALGVTFYQMLLGRLPFQAEQPIEWIHCHVARKPAPPAERLNTIPAPVSGIVMKLLAKTPDERYQTAAGVEYDLRRCLSQLERSGRIDAFTLGERDTPDRLTITETLYGREREVEFLVAAFDRVATSGTPELVLVSGYSGIGKSSVVNELTSLVRPRGLFASGKFDQLKRDIPYATLVQAFQRLIRPLLARSDADLSPWREALLDALGPNARLIVDLIPELKLIVGEQPPVPELDPPQAQRRFQLALRNFIGVVAQPERPLALFLDDLQWLDAATLDLIEDLLTRSDVRHLMLIGAYRDNEVDAAHPLQRKLRAIKSADAKVTEIMLQPLDENQVRLLIADIVCSDAKRTLPLARLAHEKTAGNPFFMLQFLRVLADEGLLTFDHELRRWSWDLGLIQAKGYTDNVVDLLVTKLARLPKETQRALQTLACLGATSDFSTLTKVLELSEVELHVALWPAVRLELVAHARGAYRFVHDRVQEAAYLLVREDQRAAAHLMIGRHLVAWTPPEQRELAIFEIVNQLNRGAELIVAEDELEQLAEFNLIAAKRAIASTAYASALNYLAAGSAAAPSEAWKRRHELLLELELTRAECEFLTGALVDAIKRLETLSTRTGNIVEQARIACLHMDLFTMISESAHAVAVGLDYLRRTGVNWTAHPTDDEVSQEYARIWSRFGGAVEELVNLPLMSDPASLATLEVLAKLVPPAFHIDANLIALVACRAVNLSIAHGNSDASCPAYVYVGMTAGRRFGDYQAGYRFGRVGCDLVEQRGLTRLQARTLVDFGNIILPWTHPLKQGRDYSRRAFDAAIKGGDLTYAAYACDMLVSNFCAAGDLLEETQREAEFGLAFAQRTGFSHASDTIASQIAFIRTLRGHTPIFGCFDCDEFDETAMERHFASNPGLIFGECWYWVRKLQARFLAGDYAAAINASLQAKRLLWTSQSHLEAAEYHFYGALSRAACCDFSSAEDALLNREALVAHHRQVQLWAQNCPENFENRTALIEAEIARLEGRDLDAQGLYQNAIRSSQASGFAHNEAVAYELAARFYAARGFEDIARLYRRNARSGYVRWGADGKVRQLEEAYPYLAEETALSPTSTIATPVGQLDLATVIKVSQAVSSEIELENLLDILMRTAIEQAGAERGLLILSSNDEKRITVEASIKDESVLINRGGEAANAAMMPETVVRFVLRTRESVVLNDVADDDSFSADPYIRQRRPRSILCLPLINQAKLIGVLYLENNIAPHIFAPPRLALLKLLASQAAISLENSRLYRDLKEREGKIRRLVDANIVGIYIWGKDAQIAEANDAFLRMIGYERADLVSGHVNWRTLTPPEWLDHDERRIPSLRASGVLQPFEKEYIRKDGARVPVLVGGASFGEGSDEGVAFVLDLTERRSAADALREMQMQLGHANRVATLGQLTASIAHEVKQPICASVTNAEAALRWLDRRKPHVDEARQALGRIVRDGQRASAVVNRIRDLVKKAPPRKNRVEINEAIREVVDLTHSEAMKCGVSVKTELNEALPAVDGDRVELQQVILNLMLNAIEAMRDMPEGPCNLRIATAKTEAGDLLISVLDSGPGLAPAVRDNLFQAFQTTKPTGLGLGLSICRSIIEAHEGRLWATDNAPRGAVFQFTLPANP